MYILFLVRNKKFYDTTSAVSLIIDYPR